jgi:peptidylprolyl isomerase
VPVATGTANPEGARVGDRVAVYYTGALTNGTVFDSNTNATTPVEFILGNSSVIQGLNEAIEGMAVNEQKTVTIPPEKAYGAYNTSLIRTVNRTGPLANTTFSIGRYYTIHDKTTTGVSIVKILNITPTTITWDANDPLAGMDVVFTIRLVKITRA